MPRQKGNISMRQENTAERFTTVMKIITGTDIEVEEELNNLLVNYPLGTTIKGIVAREGEISVVLMCKTGKK